MLTCAKKDRCALVQAKLFRRRLRPIHKRARSLSPFPSWDNTSTSILLLLIRGFF
jgi:hypothetical protein